MKTFFLSTLFCCFYLTSTAQNDFLEPADGFFSSLSHQDEYYSRVKSILYDSLQYRTDARFVVLPSFSQEYLVSIDSQFGKTYLTYRVAKRQIWSNMLEENLKHNEFKMNLDNSIAKSIHDLIFSATSKVKYSDYPTSREDGTIYFFIVFEPGYGVRSGTTWSPSSDKLKELIEIVDWLVDCAKNGYMKNQDEMKKKINELIEKFKNQ